MVDVENTSVQAGSSSRFAALRGRVDVVLIGASAGGVSAVSGLLRALPASFDLPMCVVLHIPADRPSHLAEAFGARSRVAVKEAEDKAPLAGGTVVVAAPDYHLLVEADRTCALSIDPHVHYSRPSIDVLFESAVDAYGPRALAMLLTGANEDGARGLAALAEAGAITVVQDPEEAEMPVMPEAALARCTPTFVLPLAEIVGLLHAAGTPRATTEPG
jgi:two-component system chemotaxis response regulator CheB